VSRWFTFLVQVNLRSTAWGNSVFQTWKSVTKTAPRVNWPQQRPSDLTTWRRDASHKTGNFITECLWRLGLYKCFYSWHYRTHHCHLHGFSEFMKGAEHIWALNINGIPPRRLQFRFPTLDKTMWNNSVSTFKCISSQWPHDECSGFHISKCAFIISKWKYFVRERMICIPLSELNIRRYLRYLTDLSVAINTLAIVSGFQTIAHRPTSKRFNCDWFLGVGCCLNFRVCISSNEMGRWSWMVRM